MALRQLGLFQLNTNPGTTEIDFGTAANPLDEIFVGTLSAAEILGDGSNIELPQVDSLETRLSVEESARATNDLSLQTKISTDVQQAIEAIVNGAPSALDTLIEIANKIGDGTISEANIIAEVNSVGQRIAAEETTRLAADNSIATVVGELSTALGSEIDSDIAQVNASVGSVETRLSAEEDLRASQVQSLAQEITGELNADILSVDTRMSDVEAFDTSLETRVSDEEAARAAAENSIDSAISTTNSAMTATFNSVDDKIATEVANIDGDIADEATARAAADVSLSTKVDEEAAARATSDYALDVRISTLEANPYNDSSINERVSTVEAEADALDSRLTDETANRLAKDASIMTVVNQDIADLSSAKQSLTIRVSAEEAARAGAATSLQSAIAAEQGARVTAINSVDAAISSEVSTIKDTTDGLSASVQQEQAARVDADDSLTASINNEANFRALADVNLSTAIESEAASRIQSDAQISSAVSSEVISRIAADLSLEGEIDSVSANLASEVNSVDSRIDTVEGDASSLETRVASIEAVSGADMTSVDTRISNDEDALVSAKGSVDVRVAAVEGDVVSLETKLDADIAAEENARNAAISAAVDGIIDGAGSAYDTLKEIQTELENNDTDIATILTAQGSLSSRVSTEEAVRLAGDDALQANVLAVDTELSSVKSSLMAADNSLQTVVFNNNISALDGIESVETVAAAISSEMSGEVASIDVAIAGVSGDVSDVASDLVDAEASLASDIASEATARANADSSLSSDIATVSTALASEIAATNGEMTSINARVSNDEDALASEIARATTAEGSLETRVAAEEGNRASGDASVALKVSSAQSSADSLDVALTAEVSTRIAKDASLETSIDGLDARMGSEEAKSVSLSSRVDGVESDLASEVNSIDTRVDNIEQNAYDDTSINARMGAAEAQEISATGSLDSRIAAEESLQASNAASLEGDIAAVSTALASEITATNTDVNTLTADLASEVATRGAADSALSSDIAAVSTALASEVGSTNADVASINTRVADEESARAIGDDSLTTRVSTEEVARAYGDASLADAIAAEASSRIDSEDYVVSASIASDVLTLTRAQGGVVTVDMSEFKDNTDDYVTGVTLSGQVLTLGKVSGDVSVSLADFATGSEMNSAIAAALVGYATEAHVASEIADFVTSANITSEITSAVSVETARAETVEAALSAAIESEASSRVSAEDFVSSAALDGNILELTRAQGGVVTVDLSQFMDDTDTDNYITGATLTNQELTLSRTGALGNITVDLSGFTTASELASAIADFATTSDVSAEQTRAMTAEASLADSIAAVQADADGHNELSGASFAANTLTISGSEASYTVNLASLATDVNVTAGSYDSAAGELTLTKSDGSSIVVEDFYVDVNGDNFVTGATLTDQTLSLERNGLASIDVSLASFVTSGELAGIISAYETKVDSEAADISLAQAISAETSYRVEAEDYVSSAALVGNVLNLTRIKGGVVSVDLAQFMDDEDNYVTGATLDGQSLTLSRHNGDMTVDLSSFVTSGELTSAIADFNTASEITAEISTAVSAEAVARAAAFNGYATESYVQGEIADFKTATQITSEIDSAVGAEQTRAITAEDSLAALISAEQSAREVGDDYVASAAMSGNSLVLTRAQGGSVSVDLSQFNDNTDNYVTGATLVGQILTLSRTNGSFTVDLSEFVTSSELNAAIANFRTATEISTDIDSAVSAEAAIRLSVDGSLHTRVGEISSALVDEITSTGSEVGSLTTRISKEESTRVVKDGSLGTAISGVATSLGDAKTSLTNADTSLTTRVSTEESTRLAKDNSLGTAISSEASSRASADLVLAGDIGNVSSDLGDETAARIAGDGSLTTRVGNEESARAIADSSLESSISVLSSQVNTLPVEDNYLVGASMSGNNLLLDRTGSLSTLSVDLSQFLDNTDTDNFVSGATLTGDILTLARTNGDISVNLGQYQTASEVSTAISGAIDAVNQLTGASFAANILTISGATQDYAVNLSALASDVNVTAGSYDASTGALTLTKSDNSTIVISDFYVDVDGDNFVTGATLTGQTLRLERNGLADIDVSLASFVTSGELAGIISAYATKVDSEAADISLANAISAVQSDFDSLPEDENDFVSSAAMVGNSLRLTRTDGAVVAVDLSQFMDDTDNFVSGASISGDILTLARTNGNISVNLGQYQTASEVSSAITTALVGYATEAYVGSAIAPLAAISDMNTADNSLQTRIASLEGELDAETSSRIEAEDYVISAEMSSDILKLTRAQGGIVTVDLSQFKDDTDTDNFVSGASITGDVLTLARTNGNISVNLGQYQTSSEVSSAITSALVGYATEAWVDAKGYITGYTDTNSFVTGATFAANTLTIKRNDGLADLTVSLASLASDVNVVSGSYDSTAGELTLTKSDNSTIVIEDFYVDIDGDNFITGATLSGQTLSLERNGGLADIDVNLASFVTSGELDAAISDFATDSEVSSAIATAIAPKANTSYVDAADASLAAAIGSVESSIPVDTNDYVNSATLSGNTLVLGRTGGLSNVTVDLTQFMDDTNTDEFVSGATLDGDLLSLERAEGADIVINLGQYQTSSEVSSAITSALAGYATEAWVEAKGYITGYTDTNDYVSSATVSGNNLVLTRTDGESVSVDLSSFKDDTDTDTFITGASLSGQLLTLSRASGAADDVTVNLATFTTSSEVSSAITSALAGYATESFVTSRGYITGYTNNYVSGATFGSNTLTIKREGLDDLTVSLASLASDVNVTSGSYDSAAGELTLTKSDNSTIVIEDFYVDVDGDNFITGATLTGQTLSLERNGGLADINVSLASFITTAELDARGYITGYTDTNDYVNSAAMSGNNLVLGRTDGESVSVDLSQFMDDTDNDKFVTGASMSGNNLVLSRNDAGTISVDLSQFMDDTDTDTFITGASMSGNSLVLSRASGTADDVTVDLSQFLDNLDQQTLSLNNATGVISISGGNSIDLDGWINTKGYITGFTNNYVSGVEMSGNSLVLSRAGLGNISVDLSQFNDNEDNYVTGATMSGNNLVLKRSGGLSNISVSLAQFLDNQDQQTLSLNNTSGVISISGGNSIDLDGWINTKGYITGYTDTNSFVTGATFAANTLTIKRNDGLDDLTVSLASLASDVSVTSGSYDSDTGQLTLTKSDGGTVVVTDFYVDVNGDNFITSATMVGNNLVLGRQGLSDLTVDMSQFLDDTDTDTFITGATMSGQVLTLSRAAGTADDVTVDLGDFVTDAELDAKGYITGYTDTNDYVNSAAMSGNNLVLGRTGSLSDLTVDLSQFLDDTDTDKFVTGATMSGNNLVLTRNDAGTISVDLSQFLDDTDTDKFVTGASMSGNSLVLTRNDAQTVSVDLSQFLDNVDQQTLSWNGSNGQLTISGGNTVDLDGRYAYASHTHAYLPLAGGTLTGNVKFTDDGEGLVWERNTDGAYIKFYNDSDSDTNSRLEYATTDNGNEFHRWMISTNEEMTLKSDGLRVTNKIWASGGDSDKWNTAYDWGNHASAGYITGVTWGDVTGKPTINSLTGATFTGNQLTVKGSESNYSVDLSSLATDVTVTGGTYSSATQTLTLNKSNGTSIGVSGFAIDTDTDNYVTGATFNTADGMLTIASTNGDIDVDLDGRYITSYTNNYVSGATFNSTTGELTIGRQGLSNLTVDLDSLVHSTYMANMNQNVSTSSTPTFAKINTGQGATEVHLMNQNVRTSDAVQFAQVTTDEIQMSGVEQITFQQGAHIMTHNGAAFTFTGDVEIEGELRAAAKSFLIEHPTKEGHMLQYGNLEGPEHGVYVRGKVSGDGVIELPEYWTELVDADSITVQLTPIGGAVQHFVASIEDNKVMVGAEGDINAFYIVHAERKDIDKLTVEFKA